jgi:tRNA U34 5-carboxymethylaminomethyl modifying GTPase MnmE/TrmE
MENNSPVRILVFGSSFSGKTCLINLLAERNMPIGSGSNARGCTLETTEVEFYRNGTKYIFYDTAGLNEADEGQVNHSDALKKLIELIYKAKEGFNLVLFVRRSDVYKITDQQNYDLIIKSILDGRGKFLCVNTHGEQFARDAKDQNRYWLDNHEELSRRGLVFDDGISACVAQYSKNVLFRHVYQEFSSISKIAIWDIIDKTKSPKPIGVEVSIKVILTRAWNSFLKFIPFSSNFKSYNRAIEDILIQNQFSRAEATTMAIQIAERRE